MNDLRILITGSRHWTDWHTIEVALRRAFLTYGGTRLNRDTVVVHGGAPGADQIAAFLATRMGMQTEHHPADWNRHGKAAGPIRNREMVAATADVCLAFPIGDSPGTRGCMALAEQAGIPVENVGDRVAMQQEVAGLAEQAAAHLNADNDVRCADSCGRIATDERLAGLTSDGTEITELVCVWHTEDDS